MAQDSYSHSQLSFLKKTGFILDTTGMLDGFQKVHVILDKIIHRETYDLLA